MFLLDWMFPKTPIKSTAIRSNIVTLQARFNVIVHQPEMPTEWIANPPKNCTFCHVRNVIVLPRNIRGRCSEYQIVLGLSYGIALKQLFIWFQGKAKLFRWQNLIVLRMIGWPGPEKAEGGADSKYRWMTMHRYPVASLVLPVAWVPLSMVDWWWIAGHCGTQPPYFTELRVTTLRWKSIQFYI